MPIEFLTTRELNPGRVRIAKLTEEPDARVEYTCPKCGYIEKRREAWTEPLVSGAGANKKFLVKCSKCGYDIKFLKLKKEAKGKK
jgi:ssDNA-binding Zn-finger/Zn-ribbon topoisomerase 1